MKVTIRASTYQPSCGPECCSAETTHHLLMGNVEILKVCSNFAGWFAKHLGKEANLREAWEAMVHPGWMTYFLCKGEVGKDLRMMGYSLEESSSRAWEWFNPRANSTACTFIRLAISGDLLEALLAAEHPKLLEKSS